MCDAFAAAISSVISNLAREREACVFIVDAGVSPDNKEKLHQMDGHGRVHIQWLTPSPSHFKIIKSLPCGYVGRSSYCKLLIPELLGTAYTRTIYLDCDVIVEADITELWTADIGSHYVLAVQDLINPFVSSPFGLRNWRQLGRRPEDELFNAGVLVLNSAKWHAENVMNRLIQYLRDNHKFVRLCDQDAMNAVFNGAWGRLDSRWNVLQYMKLARNYSLLNRESHIQLMGKACAVHFCGPDKPWHRSLGCAQGARFFYYLDRTPWSGWRPKWWTFDRCAFVYYLRRVLAMFHRMF